MPTLQLVGQASLAVNVTFTLSDLTALATRPAWTLSGLPAGTYRTVTTWGVDPPSIAPHYIWALGRDATTTIAAGGSVGDTTARPIRVARPMDADGSLYLTMAIFRQVNSVWTRYASGRLTMALPKTIRQNTITTIGACLYTISPSTRRTGELQSICDQLRLAGFNAFRDFWSWQVLNATSDASFDAAPQANIDWLANYCRTYGMKIQAECPPLSPARWSYNGVAGGKPTDWTKYEAFVTACMNRWGDVVEEVGIYNEPNGTNFNPTTPAGGYYAPADIVALCGYARTAIQASSHPTVALSGAPLSFADSAYLQSLYDAGLAGKLDRLSIHPYGMRFDTSPPSRIPPDITWGDTPADQYAIPSGLDIIRATMLANGEDLPITVSEFGYSTGRATHNGAIECTREEQAAYLPRGLRLLRRHPTVHAVYIWSAFDRPTTFISQAGSPTDGPMDWGLLDQFGVAKPALAAMATEIVSTA